MCFGHYGEAGEAPQAQWCGADHPGTGAVCQLPPGHRENHRGAFEGGIAQWPREAVSSEPLSARWQELFWALPPGEMRSKLRALEIDTGRAIRDTHPTPPPAALAPEREAVDPEHWLAERGWLRFTDRGGNVYWRKTPNEPGWEGGWNTGGAVHQELEAANTHLLKAMGLYRPPARRKR
jgi:hypothetical protein